MGDRLKSLGTNGNIWLYRVCDFILSRETQQFHLVLSSIVNVHFTHFNEYHMQQNPGSTPLLTQETTATFLFPKATTLKII